MVSCAKVLMKLRETHPKFCPDGKVAMTEIFNHTHFTDSDEATQNSIMYSSSMLRYEDEISYPIDNYFNSDLKPMLENCSVLDLGCFTGGRSIAWYERYKLRHVTGIDIRDVYIQASKQFASSRNANSAYKVSTGELLPFESCQFDAIISFDVFEHLMDVEKTLAECHRVLKPKGKLFLVFPSYYHPTEHHLGLVTRTPCIHWFFSGRTLTKAYSDIIKARGEDAKWYGRKSPDLESWEKCNILNGTTFHGFKEMIRLSKWHVVSEVHNPIGSIGRSVSKRSYMKLMSKMLLPLAYIPIFREIALHRITFILEKKP